MNNHNNTLYIQLIMRLNMIKVAQLSFIMETIIRQSIVEIYKTYVLFYPENQHFRAKIGAMYRIFSAHLSAFFAFCCVSVFLRTIS